MLHALLQVFRTKKLRNQHHPLEASLVVLFALSSFFIGEALSFSGIVAILFCGIVSWCATQLCHHHCLDIQFCKKFDIHKRCECKENSVCKQQRHCMAVYIHLCLLLHVPLLQLYWLLCGCWWWLVSMAAM
eukprot:evm.model.scf_1418.5 EVM.evm.TU.scf_1418.5   scf_1418:40735-41127(+)